MFFNISFRKIVAEIEEHTLSRPRRALLKTGEFLYLWRSEIIRDRVMQQAASLTYTTILGIFPLMALLAFFVTVFFGGMQKTESEILQFIEKIILPSAGQDIESSIHGYFEAFRRNSAALGIFGVVGLMVTALFLFSNVEKAFNQIWQARRHRPMTAIFSRLTTTLICVPILIFASIVLTAEIKSNILSLAVPYLLTCFALILAYYVLPNTRVKLSSAVIGGVVASLCWEIAKILFRAYVSNSRMKVIFKSIGAIPVFLVWSYFTWLVVLLGSELAFLVQNYRRLRKETFRKVPYTTMDASLLFLVFLVVVDYFVEGRGGAGFDQILNRVPITADEMEKALKILKQGGMISESSDGRFLPSRPLDTMRPSDILQLGCRAHNLLQGDTPSGQGIVRVMEDLHDSLIKWSTARTVKDLIQDFRKTT